MQSGVRVFGNLLAYVFNIITCNGLQKFHKEMIYTFPDIISFNDDRVKMTSLLEMKLYRTS